MFAPSFEGQQRLWRGLLGETNAGNLPDVVKVHGTSTPLGDAIELFSVVNIMGKHPFHISAPKSQYGHMLGAAGAVEFVHAVLMLREQTVSPCLNSDNLNTELEAFQQESNWQGVREPIANFRDILPQVPLQKEINRIVCLNYGFGSTNSAIAIRKE